jgi:hypothetical protein
MKTSFRLAILGVCLPLIFAVVPASAKLSGYYTLTFLGGPSHGSVASQCLLFTHESGGILGFTDAGTFTSPTYPGWKGNYIVDSGMLRAYGTFGSGLGIINFYASLKSGKGGFDDWLASLPPIAAANDGEVTLDIGCSDHPARSNSPDPTR